MEIIQNASLLPTLIQTKFHRPRPGREFVRRARLLKLLTPPQALILITAPAGYGKTTLLSSWLGSCNQPHAWLSLDERDNDFYLFTYYIITALRRLFPFIGKNTASLFSGGTLPSQNVIQANLINDLAEIRQDFIFVLDDYHFIHNIDIHNLISELVLHPPETMHLVIAARNDPALPLKSLRALANFTEIRAADLRFTSEEAALLLRDAMKLETNDVVTSKLYERTEGWPAGLRLIGLYIRHFGNPSSLTESQSGSDRYTMDYLATEVLAKLPKNLQDFLLKTSILDRICNPICNAITGENAQEDISPSELDQLLNFDLFLTPLDNIRYWYRYHHLFQQLLEEQLKLKYDHDEIATFHSRASAWFANNGYVEEAIHHSLTAGDTKTAVTIVAQNRARFMNDENWQTVDRWVRMFPREVINEEPELLLSEVWFHLNLRRGKEILPILNRVEDLVARKPEGFNSRLNLMGEVEIRRSMVLYFTGDIRGSRDAAMKALKNLPMEWWMLRAQARLYMGLAYQSMGEFQQAFDFFYNNGELEYNHLFQRRLRVNACFIHWLNSDLSIVGISADHVLGENNQPDVQMETDSWARYFLGLFNYERGNLVEAVRYLLPIVIQPYQSYLLCFLNSAALLALAYQAMNHLDKANETVNTMISLALEIPSSKGLYIAKALQAELALRQGRLTDAVKWAQQNDQPVLITEPFYYHPPLTLLRIWLAQDTPFSRQKARIELSRLYKYFISIHNTPIQIEVLVLQALLLKAEDNEQAALDYLEKALTLAEPGYLIRVFVDRGAQMEHLLKIFSRKRVLIPYVEQILSFFPLPSSSKKRANDALPTPLSHRELEVLVLLDKRYTDKEIAGELVISLATVRSHSDHIGEKLGARGRRAIVITAKDKGLI